MADSSETGRRRTSEVRVKLAPELAERFAAIAQGRGLLPATLAASALGEFVERYESNIKVNHMVALEMARKLSATYADEAVMARLMASMFSDPGLLRAVSAGAEEGLAGQAGSSAVPEAAARPGQVAAVQPPG